ncbi:SMP-30/gluconolactonase/LRE family protein [Streptomyces kunmingensis]|uniref:SMP-30/gluconolactonase/LRE family protein n=1 Tax=Streptomyces kunmingensis TaxID=68225 RepID=A0ABU6C7M6_9ACTN|nr:SMP-30/gluconolactonase/LRE family protein [Streptomyces kunmingensis]MEB3960700.1 SMP-30/gluconolactonase/LRE family protein [Streptomyces kunmingensis]
MPRPTTVLSGFAFTESPRWRADRLWFSDFYQDRVFSAAEDGSDVRVEADVPEQPSGLGWLPDGRLLIVSMRDARILRREPDGVLSVHADLGDRMQGYANDMVVDAVGRAWVGCFGFDLMGGEPLTPAALYRVDPDGSVTVAATDLWFPNGMVITADRALLVNETFGNRVTAFDIDESGDLVNRRVWARFGEVPTAREFAQVMPQLVVSGDGACLDAEGALWIADATGARLLRVTEGGTVTQEIRPGGNVYACALGGAQGTTLFACTAPDFFEEARRPVREASIVALPVTVPG